MLAQLDMTSLENNSPGDGNGHGTLVAGLAAGSAPGHAGADPTAGIVSLDVMDDQGMARTSDVIAAAQWILRNHRAYNIRVANFSLHSATPTSFRWDPLDKAVEKLWFDGVVVVAAAGNQGQGGQSTPMAYAPANDPFVITVGALDLHNSDQPRPGGRSAVVGLGLHARRVRQARAERSWPRDHRPGAGRLDARGREAGAGDPHPRRYLHDALGHVALDADRVGHRGRPARPCTRRSRPTR